MGTFIPKQELIYHRSLPSETDLSTINIRALGGQNNHLSILENNNCSRDSSFTRRNQETRGLNRNINFLKIFASFGYYVGLIPFRFQITTIDIEGSVKYTLYTNKFQQVINSITNVKILHE